MFFDRRTHTARQKHWCDRCCEWILPGQEYERLVDCADSDCLMVFKFHSNPSCEFPEEPEYRAGAETETETLDKVA
jgi:hypothetical protein